MRWRRHMCVSVRLIVADVGDDEELRPRFEKISEFRAGAGCDDAEVPVKV